METFDIHENTMLFQCRYSVLYLGISFIWNTPCMNFWTIYIKASFQLLNFDQGPFNCPIQVAQENLESVSHKRLFYTRKTRTFCFHLWKRLHWSISILFFISNLRTFFIVLENVVVLYNALKERYSLKHSVLQATLKLFIYYFFHVLSECNFLTMYCFKFDLCTN